MATCPAVAGRAPRHQARGHRHRCSSPRGASAPGLCATACCGGSPRAPSSPSSSSTCHSPPSSSVPVSSVSAGARIAPEGFEPGRRHAVEPAPRVRAAHRRRHAAAGPRATPVTLVALVVAAVGLGAVRLRRWSALYGLDGDAHADGRFFTKAALPDLRRCVRRLALRLPGRSREPRVAERHADDRRPRSRRDDAGPAHHGGRFRRLRGWLEPGGARHGCHACSRGIAGRFGRHLLHLPAIVPVHLVGCARWWRRLATTSDCPAR